MQAAATDNGLNISLGEQHSFPLGDVFHYLQAASVKEVLEQAVLAAPLFTVRWRWAAGRSLALLRFQGGKKVPPQIQRMRAEDLLAAVFPQAIACQENIVGDIAIPDHVLVRETMNDVLTEALDLEGLQRVLGDIAAGRIRCLAVDTATPSVFSHEILNANPYAYLDDAPLEERRARAVEMRRVLPPDVASEIGRLDPSAIAEVRADAWPDVRDADELHDALLTLVALPEPESAPAAVSASTASPLQEALARSIPEWRGFFAELAAQQRATRAAHAGRNYWVSAERAAALSASFRRRGVRRALARSGRSRRFHRRRALRIAQRLDGPRGSHDGRRTEPSPRPARRRNRQSTPAPGSERLHFARAIHRFGAAGVRLAASEPNGAIAASSRAFTGSPSVNCASRSSRSRPRNSCAGYCAGNTSLPARN